ncbi:hypothetical protein [Dactylosporangium sp. CS-033363]|uniref:hypothetical protein n=1 Tax=Dactylosporangium sp. CS-033363 TaxID=3239935 RepID=UPI003D8ED044
MTNAIACAGRRLLAAGAVVLALPAVSACLPSEPYSTIAVSMDGSALQVRMADCPASEVKGARIIPEVMNGNLLDTHVPALWQVSFAEPTVAGAITVGDAVPDGGTLDVALAVPLDPATEYVVIFRYSNDGEPAEVFKPAELHDGRVRFSGVYLSHEEFDNRSACSKQ